MRIKDYLANIADNASAGTGFKSNGRNKILFLLMVPFGGKVIDHGNPLNYHLYECLEALAHLTGNQAYNRVNTHRDIVKLVMRDWDVVGGNTYTYRLAADVYRMMY